MAAGGEAADDLEYSDDGELSFSRWRSNNIASLQRRPAAGPGEESTVDFQSQFIKSRAECRSPSLQDDTAPLSRLNGQHKSGLMDRRGISLSISTAQPSSDQIALQFHGSATPSPVESLVNWDSPASSKDRHNVMTISDDEFERDFGFPSTANGELHNKKTGNMDLHHREAFHRSSSLDDAGSSGSSELSLQDLVERQDNNLFSGTIGITLLRTLFFIVIWYTFSTGLTIYNKKLLGAKLWDFPAPLLMNTVHFTMQAIISSLALRFFWPSLRPAMHISWKDYFVRVVPAAVATALDVDLTNASLVFISISLETMCKSAAPVFLLLFAFAFKLETPSCKLFGIIVIISSGVLLTGLGSLLDTEMTERRFEVLGFILVILAAIMSGFRWTVTQILLQKKEFGLNNPLAVMSHLAPVMALVTALLSLATEPLHKLAEHPFFDTYHNALKSSLLLLLGGSLAFCMVLAEYLLISKTSAVTLTVAGVVKEVVTILVAVIFLGDRFTTLKVAGLGVIMIGVCWFNWFKYRKLKESNQLDQVEFEKLPVRYVPLTGKNNDDEEMQPF